MSEGFSKEERLKSTKAIASIFENGSSLFVYPVKLMYTISNEAANLPQVGFSVPKRLHKKAVSRNLLKRRMREVYRKNNTLLKGICQEKNITCQMMFVCIDKDISTFESLNQSIQILMKKLIQKL
jgi:ribonuclease P protein component